MHIGLRLYELTMTCVKNPFGCSHTYFGLSVTVSCLVSQWAPTQYLFHVPLPEVGVRTSESDMRVSVVEWACLHAHAGRRRQMIE